MGFNISVSVNHSFGLSPALENLIMALFSNIDQKIDALDTSFTAKLAEFQASVTTLVGEIADLKTKIADPAEIAAIEAKADAVKSKIDAAVLDTATVPAPPVDTPPA